MKTFTLFKYPQATFWGTLIVSFFGIFAVPLIMVGTGIFSTEFFNQHRVIVILMNLPTFICLFGHVLIILARKDLLSVFEVGPEGICYKHPKKGDMWFHWNDIVEGGMIEVCSTGGSSVRSHEYIYVTKEFRSERKKKTIGCAVTPVWFCTFYREEVMDEIEKYYPISREVQRYRFA